MENIIEKAVEGGYLKFKGFEHYRLEDNYLEKSDDISVLNHFFLDRDFWKALGIACGWEGYSPADVTAGEAEYVGDWAVNAIDFYSTLLIEGYDEAVKRLSELIK